MNKLNKEYLKLNKNLIVSAVFSASFSALVAQLLKEQETYLNTTYTIMAGYAVFFLVFGSLYYLDSRKKYSSIFQKNKNLKKELYKLIVSLGVGEIIYLAIRWSTHYYFLNVDFEPYLASLTSETISMISYLIVVTLSARLTGLFKETD
jgi:hypothetical protein